MHIFLDSYTCIKKTSVMCSSKNAYNRS